MRYSILASTFLLISSTIAAPSTASIFSIMAFEGTPDAPCTNPMNQNPSNLELPKGLGDVCFPTNPKSPITCIQQRIKPNQGETNLDTTPLACEIRGFSEDTGCDGQYQDATYESANQTWVFDQSNGAVAVKSFGMACSW